MRDKPRQERSAETVANVEVFANKDRRVTLQEAAYQFSIGKASANQILHENIGVSKVSARRVLKQLTEDQKAFRVTIAKEHFGYFDHDGNKFLNYNVTRAEMWVHHAEPETKTQSKPWKLVCSPLPKTLKLASSAGKVMLVAFGDSRGITLAHFEL